jgi:membrane protease YdiL (CAAX protease family)
MYARRTKFEAFRVRRQHFSATAIAFLAISASLPIQYLVPICIGQCGPNLRDAALEPGATLIISLLTANIIAPFAETIMIQGWIYDLALAARNQRLAITVSALAFVLIHLSLTPTIAVSALALSVLRNRTMSLGPPALVHLLVNLEVTMILLGNR